MADEPKERSSNWTIGTGRQVALSEWYCPDCGPSGNCAGHHVPALGNICVGCPCERTEPPAAAHR